MSINIKKIESYFEPRCQNRKSHEIQLVLITSIFIIICLLYINSSPKIFPIGNTFTVQKNAGLKTVAQQLKEKGYIRSENLFMIYSVILGGSKSIKTGEYNFSDDQSTLRIAWRMNHAYFGFEVKKVTIIEGLNSFQIADVLQTKFPKFDSNKFIELAKKEEGNLFPDTYFWPVNVDPNRIISDMKDQYAKHQNEIIARARVFGRKVEDIIKMASIVEKEANSTEARKTIAGILWKRLDSGMPLQVDVTFFYINPNRDNKILIADTKVDSPYNLYKYKGLPPTPICNPGLQTIYDVMQPTVSSYWFYLSDKDGTMHYSKTHEEHVANKAKYL